MEFLSSDLKKLKGSRLLGMALTIWPEFYDPPFQTQPLLGAVVLGDGESEEAKSGQQDVQKKNL